MINAIRMFEILEVLDATLVEIQDGIQYGIFMRAFIRIAFFSFIG